MTAEVVADLFGELIYLVVLMSSALILPGLGVGLIVSMFQAATQINEQTLSFFPRLVMTFLALAIMGPWLLSKIIDFTEKLYASIPALIG